jgi:NAD-dependent dihydropyrimidine dehydrogenase PreA subunit
MAHAGGPDSGKASAASAAPCHETPPAAAAAGNTDPDGHSLGKKDSSCCANGQCFCGCIVSAVLAIPTLPNLAQAAPGQLLPTGITDFPLAQGSVLQRPPIA